MTKKTTDKTEPTPVEPVLEVQKAPEREKAPVYSQAPKPNCPVCGYLLPVKAGTAITCPNCSRQVCAV